MEAIAAHAFLIKMPWNGEGVIGEGVTGMEGRIKTPDLQHARKHLFGGADGCQTVGLVQRCQWNELLKLLHHLGGQLCRLVKCIAAMDDAVTNTHHGFTLQVGLYPCEDGDDSSGMIDVAQLFHDVSVGGLHLQAGVWAQTLYDAGDEKVRLCPRFVKRELDGGRSGIERKIKTHAFWLAA